MGDPKQDATMYSYQSVNPTPEQQVSEDAAMRPTVELGDDPQMARKRGLFATIIWQTIAFLWLVPVVALLYLNFSGYVIGASAWCPAGHCWLDMFNPVTAVPRQNAQRFDVASHDLMGGLQFVAKALEVWFGVVAAALMYLLTMQAAGKKEGLPVGYLTRPLEFADPITLIDPLLWKTGPHPVGVRSASEKRVGVRVWYLIALSIFLCVLINLMGPATAVLVIPALGWLETPKVGDRMFQQLNAASPPQIGDESWLWWSTKSCTEADFTNHNYECTLDPFGYSLDTWFSSYIASEGGAGYAKQSGLTFAANSTSKAKTKNSLQYFAAQAENKSPISDLAWWVPSRQIISNMSTDLGVVQLLSYGLSPSLVNEAAQKNYYHPDPIHTYVEYNKSLELTMVRNGPIPGTIAMMWNDYNSTWGRAIDVDANRQIRCYDNYNLVNSPLVYSTSHGSYTKCIRVGSGWSQENKKVKFQTEQVWNPDTSNMDSGVDITVYTSDKAAFFPNGVLPSWLPSACLTDGPVLNRTMCPWERMFTADPKSDVYNRTQHVTTIEFFAAQDGRNTTFAADFVAFSAFTEYSLNSDPVSNPLGVVSTGELPSSAPNIPIDPAWYLAAWSVGPDGVTARNRTSTILLQQVMQYQLAANASTLWQPGYNQDYIALLPVLQMLSLVDHSTTPTALTESKDPDHPILQRWAHMYVWSYGVTSRTAELGVAVAILGCLVVAWQVILGIVDRRRYRSPTQLIVAALEHSPRGEFEGKGHNEVEMARVRFHIKDNDAQAGKFSFYGADEKEEGTPHIVRS